MPYFCLQGPGRGRHFAEPVENRATARAWPGYGRGAAIDCSMVMDNSLAETMIWADARLYDIWSSQAVLWPRSRCEAAMQFACSVSCYAL
ncbi:hypothetical protein BN2476_230371 [Paraburkholderia piptadeniae]|uniref:Uncharacterized protein n=1 Tax=Paraburkholderia piptadeniae TaxID=1701573 RepID=A0A1N7RY54_9BURK|nr:hypothetical protein BN2476_230371 [Paraburkholderia piptadeniae]